MYSQFILFIYLYFLRSMVQFPWSARVLGQDTEPQIAPDVLVGTLLGSLQHQSVRLHDIQEN